MPILGIIASAITGNLVTSSYESIATATIGSGGQTNIEFSSIPSTYTHLQLRVLARGTSAATQINFPITLNNDTANNYRTHILFGSGTSVSSFEFGSIGGIYLNYMPAANTSASIFGAAVIDILDYTSTTKTKVFRYLQGMDSNGGTGNINFYSGLWTGTSAITNIKFNGDFAQYSSIALYGIRGA